MDALGDAIVAERWALADTLEHCEPEAPTLAGAWTVADLAAHVAWLDRLGGLPTFLGRSIVARRAIRLNDVAGRVADRAIRAARRRGLPWAIERLRADPPALLVRPSVAPVGLFEVFVHHEDIRRAQPGSAVRAGPQAELQPVVSWLLRYHRTVLPDISLVVRAGGNEESRGSGPTVVLQGLHSEVVLWLAGRRSVADVELLGDEDAVGRLTGTVFGV